MFQFEGHAYNLTHVRKIELVTIGAIPGVDGKERTYFIVRLHYNKSHSDLMQTYNREDAKGLIDELVLFSIHYDKQGVYNDSND